MRWEKEQVDYAAAIKEKLLREMTPEQGFATYFSLMAAFRDTLNETDPLYRDQRLQHWRDLQERLHRAGLRGSAP